MGPEPNEFGVDASAGGMRLSKPVIKNAMIYCYLTVLMMVVFFVSAGRIDIPRAWFYFALFCIHWLSGTIIIDRLSPELLERGSV